MFRDLQPGYPVMMLDKSTGVMKYHQCTVVSRGEPRFNDKQRPQPGVPPVGLPQVSIEKVVDLTLEYGGKTGTFVVPENGMVAGSATFTISCDPSIIVNEVKASMKKSQDHIASVPTHEDNIKACEEILAIVNPEYADTREQNKRIENLESSMDDIKEMLGQIMNRMSAPTSKKQNSNVE